MSILSHMERELFWWSAGDTLMCAGHDRECHLPG
jgi:hypothetical protein